MIRPPFSTSSRRKRARCTPAAHACRNRTTESIRHQILARNRPSIETAATVADWLPPWRNHLPRPRASVCCAPLEEYCAVGGSVSRKQSSASGCRSRCAQALWDATHGECNCLTTQTLEQARASSCSAGAAVFEGHLASSLGQVTHIKACPTCGPTRSAQSQPIFQRLEELSMVGNCKPQAPFCHAEALICPASSALHLCCALGEAHLAGPDGREIRPGNPAQGPTPLLWRRLRSAAPAPSP